MSEPNEQLIETIAKLQERFDVRLLDESEINTLFTEVRALLEENKRLTVALAAERGSHNIRSAELQQTRGELEREKQTTELFDQRGETIENQLNIIESIRTELSAKDKVLEWYARYLKGEAGRAARSILSQYKVNHAK